MRLRSVHPGVERRRRHRGHRLRARHPRRRPHHPPPRSRRARVDPRGSRSEPAPGQGVARVTAARRRHFPIPTARSDTRLCDLVGDPLPDRPDRDGLGGRPPAGGGHRRGRRPRDPGVGHHDRRRTDRRHRRGPGADRHPFGVNLRTDAPDVERAGGISWSQSGVKVASFAQAPRPDLVDLAGRRGGRGDPHRRCPASRREGGRVGSPRRHRPGRRGRRPHRCRPHHAAAPPSGRRRGGQGGGHRRRRLLHRPRSRRRPRLRSVGYRHGDAVPAHAREHRPRRREEDLPGDARHRDGGDDARWTAPPSA